MVALGVQVGEADVKSTGAVLARYSHNPAGIAAVRAAIDSLDCAVEFVLLEPDRAIVMAAVGPAILQPRQLVAAEEAIATGKTCATIDGRTAVLVALDDNHLGALSAKSSLDPTQTKLLIDLGSELSHSLLSDDDTPRIEHRMASTILDSMRDTVAILSPSFEIAWVNAAITTLLGYTPNEFIGSQVADHIHPDDLTDAIQAAAQLTDASRVYRINVRMSDALGGWVPISISGVDQTENPAIGGLLLSVRNDEMALETAHTLQETRRVSDTILQGLTDAVVATDKFGQITIVNLAARNLFTIDPSIPLSQLTVSDFRLLDTDGVVIEEHDHPLTARGEWTGTEMLVATMAGMNHLTVSRSEVSTEIDHQGVVVTFHDITQARSDARELRRRARHDQLTGLANRRYLQERLRMLEASTQKHTLAALFVDIDRFKNVNDVHGHNVGDGVLRATAERLAYQIRDIDILARPGGDEFLVVVVDPHDEQAAIEVAERIRTALARPFEVNGLRLHLTASVGVAMHEENNFDDESIMQRADIALYAAKERGRDRVEVFNQTLATVVEEEQRQRDLVRQALDDRRLTMRYQPIVDSAGVPIGFEALARCVTPDGQVVGPGEFLEAIDGTNLMVRLDHEGFAQSCALAATLAANPATKYLYVAANFSAMTIAQSSFASQILQAIEDSGAPPNSLCVEVTETAAFEAGERSVSALGDLHHAGVRIALDDFGTGYSSLSHLRDLPLSTVKIDRSFTRALTEAGAEWAIAGAVKDLAESLGFDVVAEGVETDKERAAVRELGVEMMQGWHFAHAMEADRILGLFGSV